MNSAHSEQQHKEILELCYWEEAEKDMPSAASMSVPMKKRCGITTLESITKENMCYCTERSNSAAGKINHNALSNKLG